MFDIRIAQPGRRSWTVLARERNERVCHFWKMWTFVPFSGGYVLPRTNCILCRSFHFPAVPIIVAPFIKLNLFTYFIVVMRLWIKLFQIVLSHRQTIWVQKKTDQGNFAAGIPGGDSLVSVLSTKPRLQTGFWNPSKKVQYRTWKNPSSAGVQKADLASFREFSGLCFLLCILRFLRTSKRLLIWIPGFYSFLFPLSYRRHFLPSDTAPPIFFENLWSEKGYPVSWRNVADSVWLSRLPLLIGHAFWTKKGIRALNFIYCLRIGIGYHPIF